MQTISSEFRREFGGFSDNWIPLEDWTNEENEEILRRKYPDSLLQKQIPGLFSNFVIDMLNIMKLTIKYRLLYR